MSDTIKADYLVVGSGAMGMAFTDVLVEESDASVILVDRHHQPGGHWNDAYRHVRLHQPSAFYGVNSRSLGSDAIDQIGWNKGLYELATSHEVCAYFDQVMQQQFLPSGRVQYYPMCEYLGDGSFRSLVSGQIYQAETQKTVDATYMHVTVPSMRPPPYQVAEQVDCLAPNALAKQLGQYQHYMVIGAGKTGMDACLFLLKHGVQPDDIWWVMPRDSWMLDRANIQPGSLFANSVAMGFARQTKIMAQASSIEALFDEVAKAGQLIRFDEEIWPTMYRCATVTQDELQQLRRIANIVRLGRVRQIEPGKVRLDKGEIDMPSDTLYIDCSADGLERRPSTPVFDDGQITLQSVRTCQQVFSAAFIGHVECAYTNQTEKNELCQPVPHPDSDIDFLHTSLANMRNAARWSQDAELQTWLQNARLDGFSQTGASPKELAAQAKMAAGMRETALAAMQNLQRLLETID